MSEKINLLARRKKNVAQQSKSEKTFKLVSLVCLVLVVGTALSLYILKVTSALPSLQTQEKQLLGDLQTLYPKTIKLLIIKNRLAAIDTILKKRPDLVKTIDAVQGEKPASIVTSSFEVSSTGVTFAAASTSLAAIDEYFNALVAIANEKKTFRSVDLQNLSLDSKTGTYSFSLDIGLL